MGGTTYSHDDYDARTSFRASTGASAFAYHADISAGKTAANVHEKMNPYKVVRESRDSDAHPVTVPIGILMDTTGSMQEVPEIIQKSLNKLMGGFLDDKASGKQYLGDGYPAIMISAVDDFAAMSSYDNNGTLQVGQFESGIEIDDDLGRLWFTGKGGGTYEESYDLGLYFYARHTIHDHWDKRRRKGYLFIIGDEKLYPSVKAEQVKKIIGDTLQADIQVEDILKEAQKRYHVFFIVPNMTSHYNDSGLVKAWTKLLGQQNVLKLEDPSKICEMIISAVAICENNIGLDDIVSDLNLGSVGNALVPLSRVAGSNVASYAAGGLTPTTATDSLTRL